MSRWWHHIGHYYWICINPADLAYLDRVWKGEA